MALGSLPPWLSVSPSDFVRATQAGAQLGHTIADSTLRAFEDQQRMKMAADQHEAQLSQQAIENAAVRLAADRLENYRQQEVSARNQQLGIEQQGLGLRGEGLDLRSQRISDLANAEKDRQAYQQQRMGDLQNQRDFMNELRSRGLDLRERGLNREKPVTTKLEADDYGPALSGPIDSPEITKRLKQRSDALLAKQNAPGFLDRIKSSLFGSPAPIGVSAMAPLSTGSTNSTSTARRAHAAIASGADPDAVKERYKNLTGEDLE